LINWINLNFHFLCIRTKLHNLNLVDYNVIGVMSGTSLDGLDLVAVRFSRKKTWSFSITKAKTYSYSPSWKSDLSSLSDKEDSEIESTEMKFIELLAEFIIDFKKDLGEIDAICSHGHTVFHKPDQGITFQIGNRQLLSDLLKLPLVCDFRTQDVALGGQGAPLVPIGDRELFSQYSACLNLGGFANLSRTADVGTIAYDIGAVNTVLNHLAQQLDLEYDNGGEIAKRGIFIPELGKKLDSLHFYQKQPPKSLGIEWVKSELFPLFKDFESHPIEDLLHTYTQHIGNQIAQNFSGTDKVLFTGGGVKNNFLIEVISRAIKCSFTIPDPQIIDFKEALIFGFLGVLRLENEVNCLASVTGSSIDHSSGIIFYPNF
jgi:anhydro-N-acetylmuramic acid kinase